MSKHYKILQNPNEILRATAQEVKHEDIGTEKINSIIEGMRATLALEDDGVAIAAPQVGVSLRIFVVSDEIARPQLENGDEVFSGEKNTVFINPRIIKSSRKKHNMEEGCLSIRWLYGEVPRAAQVTVEAYDQSGRKFKRGAGGIMAQIFQHEIDHLDGTLFIDKAQNVRDLPPDDK